MSRRCAPSCAARASRRRRIRKQSPGHARAARSMPATSPSSPASSPPCWRRAFRWCRRSRSSATATTSPRCRSSSSTSRAMSRAAPRCTRRSPSIRCTSTTCSSIWWRPANRPVRSRSLLDKIATYKEKTEALKKKVKKALFYPAAVLVVAVIVTVILLIFVIPQFESLFKGFGADLPAFTQMVIDLSRFVQTQGHLHRRGASAARSGRSSTSRSARGRCASSWTAWRSRSRSSGPSSTRRRSRATRARCRPCSPPACRWSRRWSRSPVPPATSSTRMRS